MFLLILLLLFEYSDGQGQLLHEGYQIPSQSIKNILGGVYTNNITLFFRNSPYRIQTDLIVEYGATITIETGVRLYFDTGVGLKVKGAIYAVGNEFAHIQMLPYQQQFYYDDSRPEFRLIDGPSVRQGRLQVLFRNRWRAVCTQLTNWTSVDIKTACNTMGFADGGFWKWYRRNNDTYPFVMPRPSCISSAKTLWECAGFGNADNIPLSENLCQGEDDIGIYCWGSPTFTGWAKHWKGLQIFNSPYLFVPSDPDEISHHRESLSRLEFVDIFYAGYDGASKNTTAALYIEGVPPIINGLRVQRSARDGIHLYEAAGPIVIANSTIAYNRGRGITVQNTTDGRLYVNMTLIHDNYGDGIYYSQLGADSSLANSYNRGNLIPLYGLEMPRLDMCQKHELEKELYFPHLIHVYLQNGTLFNPNLPSPCWMIVPLPLQFNYVYTLQFLSVANMNPSREGSQTELVVCDSIYNNTNCFGSNHLRIPIIENFLPQSVSLKSSGRSLYISLKHTPYNRVDKDISILFRIHASVPGKTYYGLNVSNSIIANNSGNGIYANYVRDKVALTNVSITNNEGTAGFLVRDGAADIWINGSNIKGNWGDGINVSYVGGTIMINGTSVSDNHWRGCAFHQNTSSRYLALNQEIIFKGRPASNIYYLQTLVARNAWGGILVGNFCIPEYRNIYPKVIISWTELLSNYYHPSLEIHSCQSDGTAVTKIDISGNRIESGTGIGFRMEPSVNVMAQIHSNHFVNNSHIALLVRNAAHPQLAHLSAQVNISKNYFKFNSGQSIVSIGLNEDAPMQKLIFNQQNEIRGNIVINPFPYLNLRSTPYAALLVSSSNVEINRNCFENPQADYEIATELTEHAKWINATENSWGSQYQKDFMHKVFDHFNRYSLARIEVFPFAQVCNEIDPYIVTSHRYRRLFRNSTYSFTLGGTIWEKVDLPRGRYTVNEDLNVVPGAKLNIVPGTRFEFAAGVGMLIQGDMIRSDYHSSETPVIFTSQPFHLPKVDHLRLVDENDNEEVIAGRLEVFINGQWGTVCNRSWTSDLALLVCNQLGLIMDPEHFENWRIFPSKGSLSMIMDNVRCEEREYDITRCRHDGMMHNVAASCASTEVVGVRCAEPRWAGVRYSLLANPPAVTGQTVMDNWVIEKAGVFDSRTAKFSAALMIDWNYHNFHNLTIRNNFWNGIDIVYNDLIKKPAIRNSRVENNRRHGFKIRSPGLTIEDVVMTSNGHSGFRYKPLVSSSLQRDIVTWLERQDIHLNNIYIIPNRDSGPIEVFESQLNQRKFLVARVTADCPLVISRPCNIMHKISAIGNQNSLTSKIAVQIINSASQHNDEDIVLTDGNQNWSVRKNAINFPIVSSSSTLDLLYTRSYGKPEIILLILFLDAQEYVDRFVHVYRSEITDNQYGVSSVHYNNFTSFDGSILNRQFFEKLWFQKVNFTRNKEAVIWVHSPEHIIIDNAPLAQIGYHIDNCSVTNNTGGIIQTHRDLYKSANIFEWNLWSNTFSFNTNMEISIYLPDTYDLFSTLSHSFLMTENRFDRNTGFGINLNGYYAFANISSNNFTGNVASSESGIILLKGMEKRLVCERNRIYSNWGLWMIKVDIKSQQLKNAAPGYIQYNYIQRNHYIRSADDYVDMWPRSYALGVFGSQRVDVHFNRLKNVLLDFELVCGCKMPLVTDTMNVTHNWWGCGNQDEINQRVFDFDDWNIFSLAEFSPFYVTEELFINFWWTPDKGQLAHAVQPEITEEDLHGRMYDSKTLNVARERWHEFPFHFKPRRPYRIIKDLTIMPNATLTIERGVEVHVWPNVRILVLGDIVANGTFWEPIRFKPINTTEFDELRNKVSTRYKRLVLGRQKKRWISGFRRIYNEERHRRRREWVARDAVYAQFPALKRESPFYQQFIIRLSNISHTSGFLEIYNRTTNEWVPSCDKEFTIRNAQVACRELGLPSANVYHWLTPRWEYNPKIRILKTYAEPRECFGSEDALHKCPLRMNGNITMWQCMDSEHFNFIHCGRSKSLNDDYIGNWGGIVLARGSLEFQQNVGEENSVLRHIEIIGGGTSHNNTIDIAALSLVQRAPVVDAVNITNSTMNGLQIISPRKRVTLSRLNVTQNLGRGLSVWVSNLQGATSETGAVQGPIELPYNVRGMLDMCAAEKNYKLIERIIVFYKYDSFHVDCVKYFSTTAQNIAFRLLLVNFYNGSQVSLGREDALSVYSTKSFNKLLYQFSANSGNYSLTVRSGSKMALHLRASAADGVYGFVGEVFATSATPISDTIDQILIRQSRLENNDRGALMLRNSGEVGPNIIISDCSIHENGYHVYGNISTSMFALELHLYNSMFAYLRGMKVSHNQGGLFLRSDTSSAVVRLSITIRDSTFTSNSNSTTIALIGNNYQKLTFYNNIISLNYALYHDTVLVKCMTANFTRNILSNNTGLHTAHVALCPIFSSSVQSFHNNWFQGNRALGHGHQYMERYGYLPEHQLDEFSRRPRNAVRNTKRKRQVLEQEGVSFDWWTHVGTETARHRSTVFTEVSRQNYKRNVFDNPKNTYELTTGEVKNYDGANIDARENYWGYPGTLGVAAAKIREERDYSSLIRVDYQPVLESNTSLIEGDCPAGWFQVGVDEFKSCFVFVGSASTYKAAVHFCQEMDAIVPYIRAADERQKELANRVNEIISGYTENDEKYMPLMNRIERQFWISGASIPPTHCGWLSSKTGHIGFQNCHSLLPFICERGIKSYEEPALWRLGVIIAVTTLAFLVMILVLLALCWFRKSRKRKEEELNRKELIRSSLKLSKMELERRDKEYWNRTQGVDGERVKNLQDEDPISMAHRSMIHGEKTGWWPAETLKISCSRSSIVASSTTDHSHSGKSFYNTNGTFTNSFSATDNRSLPSATLRSRTSSRSVFPYHLNAHSGTQSKFLDGSDVRKRVRLRDDPLRGTNVSSCSSVSETCSTCATETTLSGSERDSTLTETSKNSSSARSTRSENTIVEQPLLPSVSKQLNVTNSSFMGPFRPVGAPLYQTNYIKNCPSKLALSASVCHGHPTVLPSHSLVDLISPQRQPFQRRNSTGLPMMYETSM